MLYAAECMAMGAYRLVAEPELIRKAWEEMDDAGGEAGLRTKLK